MMSPTYRTTARLREMNSQHFFSSCRQLRRRGDAARGPAAVDVQSLPGPVVADEYLRHVQPVLCLKRDERVRGETDQLAAFGLSALLSTPAA